MSGLKRFEGVLASCGLPSSERLYGVETGLKGFVGAAHNRVSCDLVKRLIKLRI